jgi:hypothetical protein
MVLDYSYKIQQKFPEVKQKPKLLQKIGEGPALNDHDFVVQQVGG